MGPLAAPAVGELAQLLRDTEVQLDVVETLGQLGPVAEPAVSALTDELAGPISAHTAEALGKIGPSAAAAAAPSNRVAHQRAEVRLAAALAMWRIDRRREDALATLTKELRGDQPEKAVRCVAELGADARVQSRRCWNCWTTKSSRAIARHERRLSASWPTSVPPPQTVFPL